MTAVMPAFVRTSKPSRKGKKASEAATAHFKRSPPLDTHNSAQRFLSCWPAPEAISVSFLTETTVFDLVARHTAHAKSMSRVSFSVGARLVTVLRALALSGALSALSTNMPPRILCICFAVEGVGFTNDGFVRTRMFGFFANTDLASLPTEGASKISKKFSVIFLA